MATDYKVLGQSAPAATTASTLYTVPAATKTVCSTLTVCNRDAATGTYRVAVRPAGATLANQHYIVFDASIPGNATDTISIGVGNWTDTTSPLAIGRMDFVVTELESSKHKPKSS